MPKTIKDLDSAGKKILRAEQCIKCGRWVSILTDIMYGEHETKLDELHKDFCGEILISNEEFLCRKLVKDLNASSEL